MTFSRFVCVQEDGIKNTLRKISKIYFDINQVDFYPLPEDPVFGTLDKS
jgi:hypothetical protein